MHARATTVVGDLRRVRVQREDGSEQLVFLGEPREGASAEMQAALRAACLGARVGGCEILDAHPYVTLVDGSLLVEVDDGDQKGRRCPSHAGGAEYRGCDRTGCTVRVAWGVGRLPLPTNAIDPYDLEVEESDASPKTAGGGLVVEVGMSDALPEALELALSALDANGGASQGEWHVATNATTNTAAPAIASTPIISATPTGWFRVLSPFCAPRSPLPGDDECDLPPQCRDHHDYLDNCCRRWVVAAERAWTSARHNACAARAGRALALLRERRGTLSPSARNALCATHTLASRLALRGLRILESGAEEEGHLDERDDACSLRHARTALAAEPEQLAATRATALRRLAAQCITMALWGEAEDALHALEEAGCSSPRSLRCMRTCRTRRLREEEGERAMCVRMVRW